jgi:hypothetical protein
MARVSAEPPENGNNNATRAGTTPAGVLRKR